MKPPATEPPSMAAPPKIWPFARTDSRFCLNPLKVRASTSQASVAPEKKVNPQTWGPRAHAPTRGGGGAPPHRQIQKGRKQQGSRAEQVGGSPPPHIRDHPCRHLEDHHPGREEGIGGESLDVAEAGVEQE